MFPLSGAGDRVRTDDIYLGKVTLYQLSYARIFNTYIIITPFIKMSSIIFIKDVYSTGTGLIVRSAMSYQYWSGLTSSAQSTQNKGSAISNDSCST